MNPPQAVSGEPSPSRQRNPTQAVSATLPKPSAVSRRTLDAGQPSRALTPFVVLVVQQHLPSASHLPIAPPYSAYGGAYSRITHCVSVWHLGELYLRPSVAGTKITPLCPYMGIKAARQPTAKKITKKIGYMKRQTPQNWGAYLEIVLRKAHTISSTKVLLFFQVRKFFLHFFAVDGLGRVALTAWVGLR